MTAPSRFHSVLGSGHPNKKYQYGLSARDAQVTFKIFGYLLVLVLLNKIYVLMVLKSLSLTTMVVLIAFYGERSS